MKFPRLEDWGEMTQEVEMATVPQPVELYKVEVVEQCDKTAYIHQTTDLVDKETNTLLKRSRNSRPRSWPSARRCRRPSSSTTPGAS